MLKLLKSESPRVRALWQEKPLQWESWTRQLECSPPSNEDPAQTKINNFFKKELMKKRDFNRKLWNSICNKSWLRFKDKKKSSVSICTYICINAQESAERMQEQRWMVKSSGESIGIMYGQEKGKARDESKLNFPLYLLHFAFKFFSQETIKSRLSCILSELHILPMGTLCCPQASW